MLTGSWFYGLIANMKTTIDLPAELVREMKIRAASEGRKLKDVAAEIMRLGLEQPRTPDHSKVMHRVRFPIIECSPPVAPAKDLTPDELNEILLQQEAEWHHDTTRH